MSRAQQAHAFLNREDIHALWAMEHFDPELDKFHERAFKVVVEKLRAPRGAHVLDAGCGYALNSMRLARLGLEVTAIDFCESAVTVGRSNVATEGLGKSMRLLRADLLQLPFEDASFDFVTSWGALLHVPEMSRATAELARVLKPGGRMALMEMNRESLHVRVWEPLLRAVKKVLGHDIAIREETARGVEEWIGAAHGGILVRKSDMRFLEEMLAQQGLMLVDRFAAELTDIYTSVPHPLARRAIHAANRMWFEHVKDPTLAVGNVLILEKQPAQR